MEGKNLAHKKHILDFLGQEKVGVLSTVRENGFPDAAVIYYYLDKNNEISFLSRSNSRKLLNLDHQKQVLLTVLRVATKEVVQVRGVAEIQPSTAPEVAENLVHLIKVLENDDEAETVLPLLKHKTGDIMVVKIHPEELRWRKYSTIGLEEEKVSL
jgi:nitroimidazol reductase NimA-like FMN-containing flavoprotein (pyridoxamine 5'-phosphate oxidase superfamily)